MVELMVSAPASGSGKTVLTCALLSALKLFMGLEGHRDSMGRQIND